MKLLLKEGVLASKTDSKGLKPLQLARKHEHNKVALVIEFWESPSVNHDMDDAPNLEYDPAAAADRAKLENMEAARDLEKRAAAENAELEAGSAGGGSAAEQALAKRLGVTVAKKSPPRTSKQPPKAMQHEAMGDLETDDKEALMSSYQRFHADEGGGEGSKEGKLAKTKTKKKKGKQEEEEYDW